MQASAVSQTNSPANIPAPQAQNDVNRADAASPFALLMEATAKSVKKDIKDSANKAADDNSVARQDGLKQNPAKQDDNAAAAQANAKQAAPAKAGKPEKNSNKDKDGAENENGKAMADDKQAAAPDQPVPVAPAPIAAIPDTDTDAAEEIRIDTASSTPPALPSGTPSSGMDAPQSDPLNASANPEADTVAQAPAAPQGPTQSGSIKTDESEATAASAAAQAAPAGITAKDTAKPVKTAAKSEPAAIVNPETSDVERTADDLTQAVKASDKMARGDQENPAKTDIASANGTNGGALKGTHDVTDNAMAAAPDSRKADAPQADARPVETDPAALAAAKPAPHPAAASNAAFAINTIAAPQAAQHSQAPVVTQHVQVTAQAAPDVPALAVEIAAKSQSGAKQFDIRLDPPELGRVEVRLSIDATGKASAHLSADQPQTLSLLQKDAPMLTRALREAGLDVSQDGLNFSLRQQASGQNGNDGNNGRFAGSRAFSMAATASIDPTAATIAYRAPADGRVDIRV